MKANKKNNPTGDFPLQLINGVQLKRQNQFVNDIGITLKAYS
jgi:hypothetical protein